MSVSKLSFRVGNQRAFAMEIDHRRAWGLRILRGLSLLVGLFMIGVCEAGKQSTPGSLVAAADAVRASVKPEESRMWMTVGERRFAISLSDNAAGRAFAAQLPLTLDMRDLNGNEKHASLPKALPRECEPAGNDPQWRSHAVWHANACRVLSDI